jgi:hypothetical protein
LIFYSSACINFGGDMLHNGLRSPLNSIGACVLINGLTSRQFKPIVARPYSPVIAGNGAFKSGIHDDLRGHLPPVAERIRKGADRFSYCRFEELCAQDDLLLLLGWSKSGKLGCDAV